MGILYELGNGCEKDVKAGFQYYVKSAALGCLLCFALLFGLGPALWLRFADVLFCFAGMRAVSGLVCMQVC